MLDDAHLAWENGDPTTCLQQLVELWRAGRQPGLRALILELDQQLEARRGPIPGKTARERADAWRKIARLDDAADTGRLARALPTLPAKRVERGLKELTRRGPDPRTTDALLEAIERYPNGLCNEHAVWSFWRPAIALCIEGGDTGLVERLERARQSAQVGPNAFRGALQRHLELYIATCPTFDEQPDPPGLDRWSGGGSIDLDALFRAVYDAPDRDAPRAVLADALTSHADPRGEFLTLQLAASPTRDQRKRAKELVTRHAATWLGPLAPLLTRRVRWDRGFPVQAKVRDNAWSPEVRGLVEWRTFEALDLGNWGDSELFAVPWPVLTSLQNASARTLARGATLPKLAELDIAYHRDELKDTILAGSLPPSLRSLRIQWADPIDAELWSAPLFQQLEQLTLARVMDAGWLQQLKSVPTGLQVELELSLLGTLSFEGPPTRISVSTRRADARLATALAQIDALESVHFTQGPPSAEAQELLAGREVSWEE